MSEDNKPWTLSMGCHNGTYMSRDVCPPLKCSTLAECEEVVKTAERFWRARGYAVWYAVAREQSGKEVRLKDHPCLG